MHDPSVFDRVRVSDRNGEFIIVRIDHLARIVDLISTLEGKAFEINVPFNLLSESPSFAPMDSKANARFWSAETHKLLESSSENLRASIKATRTSLTGNAQLRDMLRTTFEMVRNSRQRITESDRVIARARLGHPPPRE